MKYSTIIRIALKNAKITQKDLAEALGIGQPAISNILTRKNVDGMQLYKLLDILDLLGYEVIVQKKLCFEHKEGQMILTNNE